MEHKREGGKDMAVLAKPIGVAFEVEPSKVKAFLNSSKRGDSQKAIERSKRHPSKKEKSK
jgi:hypothetical protein